MLDSLADYLDIFADNFVHLGPTYIPYPKMRFVDDIQGANSVSPSSFLLIPVA